MTNFKQLTLMLAVLLGLVTLAPALAFAQSYGASVTANTSANVGAAGASANVSGSATLTAAETKAISRGDQEITRRIQALNDLNTRVQGMQAVTDSFKQNLAASIQTEITTLTTLKAKIDADTDLATLKTDIQSITKSYRVYVLILPQGRIAAAADRVVTIVSMMSTLGSKLQARVQTASSAGNDTTALTAALTDMSSKLQDAQTQAQAAVTATASLQPDNGNATVMASNTAALKQARTDIQTATKDLQAARKDITTVVSGLAKFNANVNASSTTQTSTTP
ncbi:MAG: hypothetical protein KGH79_01020 [Patescibacteria group bacterium]|nr:hypothetical protein [Patescibacteria group bacterium]